MPGETTPSRRIRILLVEDNPADVRMVQEALLYAGIPHDLETVEDGEQALAYLRRDAPFLQAVRPDVILLDLALPRLNGFSVLRQISREPALSNIPVVALTGSKLDQDTNRAYQLGVISYITKPAGIRQYAMEMKIIERLVAV